LGRDKTKFRPRNKKAKPSAWLLVAGLGILLVTALLILSGMNREKAAIEVTGAPKIKVDRDAFDFGNVRLGKEPVRVVVRVTNVGDQPLEFSEPPYLEVLEGC
jgi:hypothetical protein